MEILETKRIRITGEKRQNWQMNLLKMTTKQFENKCLQAEEVAHFNQSSKVYSIMRDILGTSATNTAKLVNKQNGKSLNGNGELIKELLNGGNEEGSTKFPLAATDLDICTDNLH